MKNKNVIFQLITICFCFLGLTPFNAKGQYQVNGNVEDIENVRNGTTYIVINHLDSPSVKPYIDVFNKYWTFSKIAFVTYSDAQKIAGPGKSFFLLNYTNVATYTYQDKYGIITTGYNTPWTYLGLSTYINTSKKDSTKFETHLVSRTELISDISGVVPVQNLTSISYGDNGGGYMIKNWGPGILKNYIQQLMVDLNKKRERALSESIINERELKNLKIQTLYVPDYVPERQRHQTPVDIKELFKDYEFDYQLISMDSLNNKILNDEKGFYYLMATGFASHKFIQVVNSKTGEVVYAEPSAITFGIKPKDFKTLSKKIDKAGS